MGRDLETFYDEQQRSARWNPFDPGRFMPNTVFIGMAFKDNDVYRSIREVCDQLQLTAKRVDESTGSGFVHFEIKDAIDSSEFCIFDLTGERPNVYYELGFAHGIGNRAHDILLIAKQGTALHFDVAPLRVDYFADHQELREIVRSKLTAMMRATRRPEEGRREVRQSLSELVKALQSASRLAQSLRPPDGRMVATLQNLASALDAFGQLQEAKLRLDSTLGAMDSHRAHQVIRTVSAPALGRNGRDRYPDEECVRVLVREAVEIVRKLVRETQTAHPALQAHALTLLAEVAWKGRDVGVAEESLGRALQVQERVSSGDHPDLGMSQLRLAQLLHAEGYSNARALAERAVRTLERCFPSDDPCVMAARRTLEACRN